MLRVLILLAAVSFTGTALAQDGEFIGLDVRDVCEDPDQSNQDFCDTLFMGIAMGARMARAGKGTCLPDDVYAETLRYIYVEATWDDIRLADKPFRETLAPIFGPRYPCKDGGGKK